MDQVYWVEHKVRCLINERGMRPSKAISRVLGLKSPEEIKALSTLWVDGSFSVSIGTDMSTWISAYDHVRSCMQGYGELCCEAYSPHGTAIAVVNIGGLIRARALVREDAYNTAYGELSWALLIFLRVVCQFTDRPLFDDVTPRVTRREVRQYVIPVGAGSDNGFYVMQYGNNPLPKWTRNLKLTLISSCANRAIYLAHHKAVPRVVTETVDEVLFTPFIDR